MLKTNKATLFSKKLCEILNSKALLKHSIGVAEWTKNWAPSKKRETIDVAGLDAKRVPKVLIEVELLREDPSSNVVKIWQFIENGVLPKDVIVVHAFSKWYRRSKEPRKARALFVGEKMHRAFPRSRYVVEDFDFLPRKGTKVGGGARDRQARRLANTISESLKPITHD